MWTVFLLPRALALPAKLVWAMAGRRFPWHRLIALFCAIQSEELSAPTLHVADAARCLGLLRQLELQGIASGNGASTSEGGPSAKDATMPRTSRSAALVERSILRSLLQGRRKALDSRIQAIAATGASSSKGSNGLRKGHSAGGSGDTVARSLEVAKQVLQDSSTLVQTLFGTGHGSGSSNHSGSDSLSSASSRQVSSMAVRELLQWRRAILRSVTDRICRYLRRESNPRGLATIREQIVADAAFWQNECGSPDAIPQLCSELSLRVEDLLHSSLRLAQLNFQKACGSAKWVSDSLIDSERAREQSSSPPNGSSEGNPASSGAAKGSESESIHPSAAASRDSSSGPLDVPDSVMWHPPLARCMSNLVDSYNHLRPCLSCLETDRAVAVFEDFLNGIDASCERTISGGKLKQAMLAEGYGADDVNLAHSILRRVQEELTGECGEVIARFASEVVGEGVALESSPPESKVG